MTMQLERGSQFTQFVICGEVEFVAKKEKTQASPDQSGIYTRSLCTAQIYKAAPSSAVFLGLVLLPFISFTFHILHFFLNALATVMNLVNIL